jgi:hypothetical protein
MAKRKSDVKEQTPEVPVPASGSVSEETKVVQQPEKEKAKTETHSCGDCRFYDHSTEREFHRDGIRKGLVETRAICRAPKERTKASLHLVKKGSNRPCFEAGVYVPQAKKEKEQPAEKKIETKTTKTQPTKTTSTVETKETPVEHKTSRKHEQPRVSSATNVLSGDTKILETNGHDKKVVVRNIA